ncbi:MAG: T9SS type A sorting domain-containing protein [Bacteroidales bacterium]
MTAPIGVFYNGQSYKTVIFSLPLFFIRHADVKSFFEYVLVNNFSEPLGVEAYSGATPDDYCLMPNYPNPFNPSTNIVYSVLSAGRTSLKVFDILGNEISTLVDNFQSPGRYTVGFNAGNLPSGVYFYQLKSGERKVLTGKMVLIR